MAYVTESEIEKARKLDLFSYLYIKEQHELMQTIIYLYDFYGKFEEKLFYIQVERSSTNTYKNRCSIREKVLRNREEHER